MSYERIHQTRSDRLKEVCFFSPESNALEENVTSGLNYITWYCFPFPTTELKNRFVC